MSDEVFIEKDDGWSAPSAWTSVPNAVLRDNQLSWEARGMLAYLASHSSRWQVSLANLSGAGQSGRDRTRRILKELQDAGYLDRRQHRGERARYTVPVYYLRSRRPEPSSGSPKTGFQSTDFPPSENPTPIEVTTTEDHLLEDQKAEHQESKPSGAKAPGAACADAEPMTPGTSARDADHPPLSERLFDTPRAEPHSDQLAPRRKAKARTDRTTTDICSADDLDTGRVHAGHVTAAWVDAYRAARDGIQPTKSQTGQVSRSARECLEANNDPAVVLDAATVAGQLGYVRIDQQLGLMTTTRNGRGSGPGNNWRGGAGHTPYQQAGTDEDYQRACATGAIFG